VKARVLLVDVEDEARTGLAQRLRRIEGVELVGAARDTSEATRLVDGNEIDVVLVDLHQRDGSEVALCQELRALVPAPLVALASFMTPERWAPLERAGVNDCLLKHVDTDRLGRELLRVRERYRAKA
jgi:DNA-binding NarL/FixJ family response regulator